VEPQWAQFFKGIRKELKKAKPLPGLAAAATAVLSPYDRMSKYDKMSKCQNMIKIDKIQ
jgi:hypothetical protein